MKKNNRAKILINIVFIAIIIGVICKVFGGQSEEIIEQISKMTFATLFIIILCSAFFNAADGEKGNLKSGMAAQAKIVVDDDSVLHFVLSKINLVD